MNADCLKVTKHADGTVSVRMTKWDAEQVFEGFKSNAQAWPLHKWNGFQTNRDPAHPDRESDAEVMAHIEAEVEEFANRVLKVIGRRVNS